MVIFGGLWKHKAHYDDDSSHPSSAQNQQHRNYQHAAMEPVTTWHEEERPRRSQGYLKTVLFGGLWARRSSIVCREEQLPLSASESSYQQQQQQQQQGEVESNEDLPSLTSNFEAETDWEVLRLCGWYTLTYLLLAVLAFSFVFEKWTVIDSLYFAVATFTTVGYGDLQPSTEPGQIFTILFAVYGVIILGVFIGIVGHAISEGQANAIKKLKRRRQHRLLQVLTRTNSRRTEIIRNKGFFHDHITLMSDIREVCRAELPEILVVILLAWILGIREGWSFTSTMYFAIMSASTTGYGDYTPTSQMDKLFCIFFLPVSVAVFGEVLGRIASVYIQRRTRKAEQKFLCKAITLCDLRNMDTNEDGMVSMEEWLTFMLVVLQKVDQESIDELKEIFYKLDTNGNGVLEKDDIVKLNRKPAWRHIRRESLKMFDASELLLDPKDLDSSMTSSGRPAAHECSGQGDATF